MIYLEYDDLIASATRVIGSDAYSSVHDNAAALMESLARNHALVDVSKRLALAAVAAIAERLQAMTGPRLPT